MMNFKISLIIRKYLSSRFSSQTEERVQKWIIKDEYPEEKKQASLEYWNELSAQADSETYSALKRVNQRIGYTKNVSKLPLYTKIRRIAAVIIPLIILTGGYLYYNSTKTNIIEVATLYGETKHLILPDSSEIWLNAGTTIKYPEKFNDKRRIISLEGEAYFSVRRNVAQPFVVETGQLSVKVLGTEFNVRAYTDDEKVITTLTSGKVEVKTENKDPHILKPNDQLIYNRITSSINISEALVTETSSWMAGQLIFSNSSLNEIIKTLERQFNISIINNTKIPASKLYTVKFLKGESLDEILDILEDVIGFDYQKQKGVIILNNKI